MKSAPKSKKIKKVLRPTLINESDKLKMVETKSPSTSPSSVSWQGNQPGYYKHTGMWYLIVTLVTVVLLFYAYKDKNNSFLFLILALYALVLAKSAQGPQTVYFSLNQTELSINDERHYSLKDFGGYYTINSDDKKYIAFRYPEAVHEDVIVPIDADKLEIAIALLDKTELKEDLTAKEPMVHYISRVLKI